jgi:hypothetical protein
MKASFQLHIDWIFATEDSHLVPKALEARAPVSEDLALIPQRGDVVVVAPRSAWVVVTRHFQWETPDSLRVRVHLAHAPEELARHHTTKPTLVVSLPTPGPD